MANTEGSTLGGMLPGISQSVGISQAYHERSTIIQIYHTGTVCNLRADFVYMRMIAQPLLLSPLLLYTHIPALLHRMIWRSQVFLDTSHKGHKLCFAAQTANDSLAASRTSKL